MKCMICLCDVFKDFGKFKFVNQNETEILLVEFKIELPFSLTFEGNSKIQEIKFPVGASSHAEIDIKNFLFMKLLCKLQKPFLAHVELTSKVFRSSFS